jgi:hypothetical protein
LAQDSAALDRAAAAIANDVRLQAQLAVCPADLFRTRKGTDPQEWTLTMCRKGPDACADACRNESDGRACANLATCFQKV